MPSAMENQWTSPKFITCPDCGERYDSNHKRRLIDTCGHPRCYSCLFVDKPCPLCQKLPQAPKARSSSFHNSVGSDSEESADHVSSSESLEGPEAEQGSQSHPDLSKEHKERAATLPARGFRTDNYFRSLYRYDPHASENSNGKITKERPRSVPSYHKSLENLSEQFWKSVERASSPLGKGTRSASPLSKNDESSSSMRSLTDDATSSHARLTVPGHTRRRASTEIAKSSEFAEGGTNLSALRAEVLQKSDISEGRTRSQSDLIPKKFVEIGFHDSRDTSDAHADRSGSPSPNHFYHGGFYAGDADRGRPASDRSSDISLPFSDSWSESSGDSDHVNTSFSQVPKEITKRWSYDENHNERLRVAEERLIHGLMRTNEPGEQRKKITKNPLQNTIHWVIDPPKQNQTEKNHLEESNLPKRPEPPKRTQSSKMINAQKLQEYVEPSRAPKSATAL